MKPTLAATLALVAALGAVGLYLLDSDGRIDMAAWFGASAFEDYTPPVASDAAIDALTARILSQMIYIPGGSFTYGSVPVPVLLDGERVERELYAGSAIGQPNQNVTLDGFYLSAFEVSNQDFDLYADDLGLPLRPDRPGTNQRKGPYPARLAWHQAQGFCDWLADKTGQPFALPSDQQWEYAARSGGRRVAYATADGTYDYLQQFWKDADTVTFDVHPSDAYPPTPYGLYAMGSNLSEWTTGWLDGTNYQPLPDSRAPAPEDGDRRRWRGVNYTAYGNLDPVFLSGAEGGRSAALLTAANKADVAFVNPLESLTFLGAATGARCAVLVSDPPDVAGFGRAPGPVPDDFPAPIVPLERR